MDSNLTIHPSPDLSYLLCASSLSNRSRWPFSIQRQYLWNTLKMRLLISVLLMPVASVLAQDGLAVFKKRLTGEDLDTGHRWGVAGTDLGIPYLLENNESIGYIFGDTFSTQFPEDDNDWRSPVIL